ncbi:MAG: iron-containing alcohol dehydrogenase [Clostridia bacterium]|nr:iron-containing alcohol dehydrogenase [Clostridia bacterium]
MFKYLMPTKVIVGENSVKENAGELVLGTKCMIVTGKTSGAKSGALGDVTDVLKDMGIEYLVYDCIGNNPTIEECVEGGKAAREFGADFLIGIGGGSPLDACKAIAVYAVNEPIEGSDFEMHDIFKGNFKTKPLPMAAIPTTAGTGSETTPYSILTLHKINNKQSFSHPDVFYKVAFLDGRYTVNLPLQIARNTAIDAMSHLLEGFTDKKSSPASDYIALEGLRIIGKYVDNLRNGNFTASICTDLLWAATLGGIVISQTGTTIVHSMGYALTYHKDIPHGMANGLLLGEYLERTKAVLPEKTKAYEEAFGMKLDDIKKFLAQCLPCEAVFTEEELVRWSEVSIKAKNVPVCPFDITQQDEIDIYKKCLLKDRR